MKTDHWFFSVFQEQPDLIKILLQQQTQDRVADAMPQAAPTALEATSASGPCYRFVAEEIKQRSHRLDGVFWPRQERGGAETGSQDNPVVLLEMQMKQDKKFQHRLAAQTYRFMEQRPQVEHLVVVVIVKNKRLKLGPSQPPALLRTFTQEVIWLSLEELVDQRDQDPMLNLLILPALQKSELRRSCQEITAQRPELVAAIITMLTARFPRYNEEQLMTFLGIPSSALEHTRIAQDYLKKGRDQGRQEGRDQGRQEGRELGQVQGRQQEAARVTLRQLQRRCGPLSAATSARIEALPLERLEDLAEALLDFQELADLSHWLQQHT